MADPVFLVDYHFGSGAIANPDGSVPATSTNLTAVAGPGTTPLGPRPRARSFHGNSRLLGSLILSHVDAARFTIRVVMRVTAPVTGRANVFEAESPACSLHLLPAAGSGDFRVMATVDNGRNGWTGVDSAARRMLQLNTWYTIDLAYDIDTLALLIDGVLVGVTAFPVGATAARTKAGFVMGVDPDLVRSPLRGEVAALQVLAGIPEGIEAELDDTRGGDEWRIRLKENTLLPAFGLGAREGDLAYDAVTASTRQRYRNATIAAASGYPAAFEMHGDIRNRYEQGSLGAKLGALLSDEENARVRGSRRSVFERGAIYWSPATGAKEVYGPMYLSYEQLGGSVSVLGLPVDLPDNIAGGRMQTFERGLMYLKNGATRAYEVHGAILQHYLATGGPAEWGFPISNEEDVLLAGDVMLGPPPTGARRSRFEFSTFYWSAATGAHEVHGAIREVYEQTGGAGLPHDTRFNGLGLPTVDESDWPVWAGNGRYNSFQHGSVVYDGAATVACPEFQLYLGLVQTEEDEGWGQGQNDLFFLIRVKRNGAEIYSKRVPGDGSFGGDNSHDLDMTLDPVINPNNAEIRITLEVEVWDEDGGFGGGDDHLGTFTTELNVANGWGLLIRADGLFSSNVDKVQRLDWQVRPRQLPDAPRDFWTLINRATSNIIYPQYAAAFSDIDDDPEWTDPDDWAEREYFGRVIKEAAAGGNCFGMVNSALHAWHGSDFGLPLARFSDWEAVRNLINIRQISYFGSDVVAQVKDQSDRGISPTQVFSETRSRNDAGEISVINLWSNTDYTGTGHSVLPVAWDDTSFPWTITVFDPNGGLTQTTISINQFNDTFSFNNALVALSGSMHYSPWGTIDHRQASPVWDPSLLLFALLLVAVGSDGKTTGITDAVGDNLLLADNPSLGVSRREIYSGAQPDPQFAGQFSSIVPPEGRLNGELLVRRVRAVIRRGYRERTGPALDMTLHQALTAMQTSVSHPGAVFDRAELKPQPLPPRLANALVRAGLPASVLGIKLRDLLHEFPQSKELAHLRRDAVAAVNDLGDWLRRQSSSRGPDFVHHIRGVRRGRLDYRTRFRLAQTRFLSAIDGGEQNMLRLEGLDGRMPLHRLTAGRDKLMTVEQMVRLGRNASFARIRIDGIPVRAGLEVILSMRAGLAAVDVLTAGERVNVPVRIETWRANQPVATRQVQHFTVPMEGGLRLTPQLLDPSGGLKAGQIETVFGEARNSVLFTSP